MAKRDLFNSEGNLILRETTDDFGSITQREYFGSDGQGNPVLERKEDYYNFSGALYNITEYRQDGSRVEIERLPSGDISEETEYRADDSVSRTSESSFDIDEGHEDFNGRTEKFFDENGTETERKYYDWNNRIKSSEVLSNDGKTVEKNLYPHGEDGEVIRIHYSYDDDGNLETARRESGSSDIVVRELYFPDGTPIVRFEISKKTVIARTVYDISGKPEVRLEFDETGKGVTARVIFNHDDEERMERTEYNRDGEETGTYNLFGVFRDAMPIDETDLMDAYYGYEKDNAEEDDEDRVDTDETDMKKQI